MPVVVEYIGPVDKTAIPSDVVNEIISKWESTLLARRDLIYHRLLTKIPDEPSFLSRIADASADQWEAFVSPYYPRADFIKLKQRVKISIAYPRWNSAVIQAFSPGGIFEQNVTAKKDRLAQVIYTLANVGVRYMGWGPGYKAVGALTGDKRITRYIGANETLVGEPVNVFPEGVVKFVRPALIALLTQGAVLATYANEKGLSDLRDLVITTVNSDLDTIVNGLKKPEYTVAYVHLEYDATTGLINVHARAETA